MSNNEYNRKVYGVVYSSENVLIKPNVVDNCWNVKYEKGDGDLRAKIREAVCESIERIT